MADYQRLWRGYQAAPHASQGVPRSKGQGCSGTMTTINSTALLDVTLKRLWSVEPWLEGGVMPRELVSNVPEWAWPSGMPVISMFVLSQRHMWKWEDRHKQTSAYLAPRRE